MMETGRLCIERSTVVDAKFGQVSLAEVFETTAGSRVSTLYVVEKIRQILLPFSDRRTR